MSGLSVKWEGSPVTAKITDETGYEYKHISAMDIHLRSRYGQPATAEVEMFLIGENDLKEIRPTSWTVDMAQKKLDYLRKLMDKTQDEINRLRKISIDQLDDKPQYPVPDTQQATY